MTNTTSKTKTDSFTLQGDGSIDVVAGGVSYRLPPSTLGRYRSAKALVMAATRSMADALGISAGDLQAGRVDDVDPSLLIESEELFETSMLEVVREIFASGGCPLPEDENEWAVWLTDAGLPSKILAHWKSTPLARGR